MPDPILQTGPVDLGALDAFLLSDRAPCRLCMAISHDVVRVIAS
jgi:hypothetical protein